MLKRTRQNLQKELKHLKILFVLYSSDEIMKQTLIREMNRVKQELRNFDK